MENGIAIGTEVVVTTSHRGVFFGTLAERTANEVVLTGARCCVRWGANVKGFVGLAVVGPLDGSKVTMAAPKIELEGVTSVMECTPESVKQWESEPWS